MTPALHVPAVRPAKNPLLIGGSAQASALYGRGASE
jgi:hypothetical protein